jgi:hypothetical protein
MIIVCFFIHNDKKRHDEIRIQRTKVHFHAGSVSVLFISFIFIRKNELLLIQILWQYSLWKCHRELSNRPTVDTKSWMNPYPDEGFL